MQHTNNTESRERHSLDNNLNTQDTMSERSEPEIDSAK